MSTKLVAIQTSGSFIAIPGNRDEALNYIKDWIDSIDAKEITICDPYFKPENLAFIKELAFHKEGLEFFILSCSDDENAPGAIDLNAEYGMQWSKLAYTEPPELRAVHVAYDGQRSKNPIHDRWLIFGQDALRFGTSIASFGVSKLSEISKVDRNDVSNIKSTLEPFLNMTERSLEGKRLKYTVVQW